MVVLSAELPAMQKLKFSKTALQIREAELNRGSEA